MTRCCHLGRQSLYLGLLPGRDACWWHRPERWDMFKKKYCLVMMGYDCLVMMVTLLNGCAAVVPDSIKSNRTDYNIAIQSINDQELLLNIVRARYRICTLQPLSR